MLASPDRNWDMSFMSTYPSLTEQWGGRVDHRKRNGEKRVIYKNITIRSLNNKDERLKEKNCEAK